MPSDRSRILELALESLQEKKKKLDEEIAEITRELKGGTAAKSKPTAPAAASAGMASARKRSRFSKEERTRRSQRMKAYWDNWREKQTVK
jgi:cell division septum initiation protein DivIVA